MKPNANVNWLNPPQAEESPELDALTQMMLGAQIRDTFEICGVTFELRSLWPYEERWADGKVAGGNFYQTGRSARPAYVAASLVAINGRLVAELFTLPKDTPPEMLEQYNKEPTLLEEWRRDQLFARIMSRDKPLFAPPVLNELWTSYQVLEERRKEALTKIGPLSKRTNDGASSLSSSPAKAS